jgi:hypothetical protein
VSELSERAALEMLVKATRDYEMAMNERDFYQGRDQAEYEHFCRRMLDTRRQHRKALAEAERVLARGEGGTCG